jgi:Tol biopolymer transport system component
VTGFSGPVVSEYAADEEVVEESQSHQSRDMPGAGLIAYLNTEGNVALISPDGQVETQITFDAELNRDEEGNFVSGTGYCCLAWSPDGQILAYIQDSTSAPEYQRIVTLWLYQIADESYRELIAMEWISGFAWSPDSRQIVYGLPVAPGIGMPNTDIEDTADGLWLIDITTETSFELVEAIRDLPLVEPNWSPDGRFLSFRQPSYFGTGALVIFELDSKTYIPWDGGYGDYTWSPDGQKIVYDELFYAQEPRMRLWQADPWGSNRIALTPAEPNSFDHSPRFSPTGDQIAFLRVIDPMGISSRTLWLMNADGSDIHRLTSFEDINQFVWSPDGQQLIT